MLEGPKEYDELLDEAEKVVEKYEQKVDEYSRSFIEARNKLGINFEGIPAPPYEREEMAKRTSGLDRYMSDIGKEIGFGDENGLSSSKDKNLNELMKEITEGPSIDQMERFGELQERYMDARGKLEESELKLYSELVERGILEENSELPSVAKVREEIDPHYRQKMQEIEEAIQEQE